MSVKADLKWIKKHYGEKMMKACRTNFQPILEIEGLLPEILSKYFFPSKSLVDDIDEFSDFISFIYHKAGIKQEYAKSTKSAVELFDEAGYKLFPECKNELQIQRFKKYYKRGEELCTFHGGRLHNCRVWFAVKKNVKEIKRENFSNPSREDEYGTSVISIQFDKDDWEHRLSIKNRYNHTVENPDNTFGNNLDNIIPGLTDAFIRDYGAETTLQPVEDFYVFDYLNIRGRNIKYNYEINGVYYCPNNVIVHDYYASTMPSRSMRRPMITKLEDHQMLLDYFIFDFKTNEVKTFGGEDIKDSFLDGLTGIKRLEAKEGQVVVKFEDENKKDAIIKYNKERKITEYINENITKVGNKFLVYNDALTKLELPEMKECGNEFLTLNKDLREIDLPRLKKCGDYFLSQNEQIDYLSLPNLQVCGDNFLANVERGLNTVTLPNLEKCGDNFFRENENIRQVYFHKLKEVGVDFFSCNEKLKTLFCPNLVTVDKNFMWNNKYRQKFLRYLEKNRSKLMQSNLSPNFTPDEH